MSVVRAYKYAEAVYEVRHGEDPDPSWRYCAYEDGVLVDEGYIIDKYYRDMGWGTFYKDPFHRPYPFLQQDRLGPKEWVRDRHGRIL